MYTACGCGLQVQVAACGSFRSVIKFCRKLPQTKSHICSVNISGYLVSKFVSQLTEHNDERIFEIGQQMRK